MKLEWLEYYTQISEGVSLNQLSSQLFLSQQSLSSIINGLEKEFGHLLIRNPGKKGVYFTEKGALLKQYCIDFLNKLDNLKELPILEGEISILAMPLIFKNNQRQLNKITSFIQKYNGVNIKILYISNQEKIFQLLHTQKYELAFVYEIYINDSPLWKMEQLATTNGYTYTPLLYSATSGYIESRKELIPNFPVYLSEMSNFPCHILVYEDASQELSEETLRRCNCSSPLSLEYIPEVYMHKLLEQQCYGFFVSEKAEKRFLTSDIVLTPVKDQIAFEVSYIAINTELSPIAKAFIDTL